MVRPRGLSKGSNEADADKRVTVNAEREKKKKKKKTDVFERSSSKPRSALTFEPSVRAYARRDEQQGEKTVVEAGGDCCGAAKARRADDGEEMRARRDASPRSL